jgi:VanZ family protein
MSRKLLGGLRAVPMLMVMGTIFLLSDQPGDTLHLPPLPGIDKLAHGVVYGILAAATIFAFSERYKMQNLRVVQVVTTFFCFCYGASDEFHQSFVPGRSTSGLDLLADVGGALLVCLLWAGLRKHRQKALF